jgi:hypothetical protein
MRRDLPGCHSTQSVARTVYSAQRSSNLLEGLGTWMTSALALATPDATVPMPACATSFTLTWLWGATCSPTAMRQDLIALLHQDAELTGGKARARQQKDCTGANGTAHSDQPARAHLVQVEDELREVLDGVDVVVRGRGDERHPRLAAPQVGDVRADLLARQLATLACGDAHTM